MIRCKKLMPWTSPSIRYINITHTMIVFTIDSRRWKWRLSAFFWYLVFSLMPGVLRRLALADSIWSVRVPCVCHSWSVGVSPSLEQPKRPYNPLPNLHRPLGIVGLTTTIQGKSFQRLAVWNNLNTTATYGLEIDSDTLANYLNYVL